MEFSKITSQLGTIADQFTNQLPSIALGLLVFIVACMVARPVSELVTRPLVRRNGSRLILIVVRRSVSILIILLGLYMLLQLLGLTEFAVALLSGTGVIGLIVGFAFKDIAENFLSSLLLSMQRPFRLGDIIEVAGYLGVVNKMTSRATTLVDFNGDHIQIPNSTIYKNAIRNLTANPNMRGTFVVGIGYENDVDTAQEIALNIMSDLDAVLIKPEPQVLVDSLGSSTCNLRMYFWVDNEAHSKLKVASVLMKKIVDSYTENQISMPDDARERIIVNQEVEHTDNQMTEKTPRKHRSTESTDDITSDNQTIRQQASKARDPEEGENIL
jgi:small-conductance mechanosensitive channel